MEQARDRDCDAESASRSRQTTTQKPLCHAAFSNIEKIASPHSCIAACKRKRMMISRMHSSNNDASTRRYRKLFVRRFGVFLMLR
jgi:hypothetical protein